MYAGETDAKRVVRYQLYRRVNDLLPGPLKETGAVLALAGPRTGELGCLRHLLGVKSTQVTLAESDPAHYKGLAFAKRRWRGVRTYFGNIAEPLHKLQQPVSFLHLDMMGYLKNTDERLLRLAGHHVGPGGIVAYTFSRGREHPAHQISKHLRAHGARWKRIRDTEGHKRKESAAVTVQKDAQRVQVYCSRIQQLLGGPQWELIFLLRYSGHRVPMCVVAFQNAPRDIRTTQWQKAYEWIPTEGARGETVTKVGADEKLRAAALDLMYQQKTSQEIAAILNVPMGTVAAWRAHLTRGTYDMEDVVTTTTKQKGRL
jgi:hypothetical protein